jgi:CRISPR-associated protein Cas2
MSAASEQLYLVAYDIRDPKRWRRIFRLMKGYGEWLQLSVFQCRLSPMRHAELIQLIEGIIVVGVDHVIVIEIGPAERITPKVRSLGKGFEEVSKGAIIV